MEHGTPSGIDNFVSINGGFILFNKNKEPKFKRLDKAAELFNKLFDIAIADSKVEKNTKKAVEMTRKRYDCNESDKERIN